MSDIYILGECFLKSFQYQELNDIVIVIFHQSYPFIKGLVSFNNVIYDNMGACVAIEKHFGKKAFLRYDKRVTI